MEYQNLGRMDMRQNELAYLPMRLSNVYIAADQTSVATQKLSAGVSSDLGKVRAINEDNFLLFHFINENFAPTIEHHCHQDLATNSWHCFAVFDGIGGLESGELAAHLAAKVFCDVAAGLAADLLHDEIDYRMRDGFSFANQELRKLRKAKCGTTGTIVCTNGEQFKIHVVPVITQESDSTVGQTSYMGNLRFCHPINIDSDDITTTEISWVFDAAECIHDKLNRLDDKQYGYHYLFSFLRHRVFRYLDTDA